MELLFLALVYLVPLFACSLLTSSSDDTATATTVPLSRPRINRTLSLGSNFTSPLSGTKETLALSSQNASLAKRMQRGNPPPPPLPREIVEIRRFIQTSPNIGLVFSRTKSIRESWAQTEFATTCVGEGVETTTEEEAFDPNHGRADLTVWAQLTNPLLGQVHPGLGQARSVIELKTHILGTANAVYAAKLTRAFAKIEYINRSPDSAFKGATGFVVGIADTYAIGWGEMQLARGREATFAQLLAYFQTLRMEGWNHILVDPIAAVPDPQARPEIGPPQYLITWRQRDAPNDVLPPRDPWPPYTPVLGPPPLLRPPIIPMQQWLNMILDELRHYGNAGC